MIAETIEKNPRELVCMAVCSGGIPNAEPGLNEVYKAIGARWWALPEAVGCEIRWSQRTVEEAHGIAGIYPGMLESIAAEAGTFLLDVLRTT